MNTLFTPSSLSQILTRIEKLTSNSQRQWGKMNVAQMLALCNIYMKTPQSPLAAVGHLSFLTS